MGIIDQMTADAIKVGGAHSPDGQRVTRSYEDLVRKASFPQGTTHRPDSLHERGPQQEQKPFMKSLANLERMATQMVKKR